MRLIAMLLIVCVALMVLSGCESGVWFGTSNRLFYSNNNAITGKPLGDPGGRGAGMAGGAGNAPTEGFPRWNGGKK